MASDADIAKLVQRFAMTRTLAARAVQESPNDARALFGAAMAFRISADLPASLTQFERLCRLEPANTHFLYERGVTQEYLGRFDEAALSYAAALAAVPENFKARQALVQLKKQTLLNNAIAEMEAQFSMPDADGWRTLHLGHALAKTYEDFGELEKSFEWLKRGKAKRRKLHPYAAGNDVALAEGVMAARAGETPGHSANDAIFVAGLPRSGTTLVDRILSSHPDVTSAGEIGNFMSLLKLMSGSRTPATLDLDMLRHAASVDNARLGRAYIDSTRPVTGAAPRFIDKAPSNYMIAPFILAALPNARVICVRRHPMDSVLSNYKQIFPFDDRYYDYAYDIASAARRFIQFDRVLAHWSKVLPRERFMVLHYEDLVANQEARTRELLAFCDLAWDERCLNFQDNAAGVATPSARQVRSAMNSSAVGRWAKYGPLLDPARQVLEQNGVALA